MAPAGAAPPEVVEPRLAKLLANWMLGDLAAALNREDRSIEQAPIAPAQLARLVVRIAEGALHQKQARELFALLWSAPRESADAVDALITEQGFKPLNDQHAIEVAVDAAIAVNAKSVEEFRAGKDKALNAIVGQVMKATQGQANPAQVTALLRKKLGA